MNIILNEKEYAEKILKEGLVDSNKYITIQLLIRYYYFVMHFKKSQIVKNVDKFMKTNDRYYNEAQWYKQIERIFAKVKKHPLLEIEYIPITQREFDIILSLNNIKSEKLLFGCLCFAKYYNAINPNNSNWMNVKYTPLFRSLRLSCNVKDKNLLFRQLQQLGYISTSLKGTNTNQQVNIIDPNDTSTVILKLTDFRELGYEYLLLKHDKTISHCVLCNRLIKKTNPKQKYCSDCKLIAQRQCNREYMRNKRQKERECGE